MEDPTPPRDLSALSPWAPELATTMARVASDIAIVVDRDGVIRSVAEGAQPLVPSGLDWLGRPWVETATRDTRGKLEQLLAEVRASGVTRRREVDHPGPGGADIPLAWSAIELGAGGPVVAVGRDLRAVAAIQQRFLDAQQELERDYWRRRQAESRYRLIFQVAGDAVLVVDAATLEVVDANEAAHALLGGGARLAGQTVAAGLAPGARAAVLELLGQARSTGRAGEIRVRLDTATRAALDVVATPFRAGDQRLLLVRGRHVEAGGDDLLGSVMHFVDAMSDAVVVTDGGGRIEVANDAFLRLVDADHEARLQGRPLVDVVGDPEGHWQALIDGARRQGLAAATRLRVLVGPGPAWVRASATLLADGERERLGFVLHVERDAGPPAALAPEITEELQALAGQLGRVPLDDLLAEARHAAERHFVEVALLRSGGMARLAAELLGITPDSLALRAQRLGLPMHGREGADGGMPPATH